ncbi:MAG: hypothetical protein RLZZ387_922 [Chloroflexota bacterium]|jgi:hypothetical protein
MAREDYDPQEPRATRSMRREQPSTDRLSQTDAHGDPLNPNWRSERAGAGRSRNSRSVPFSRQEFTLWLQYGGWRFILVAVAILFVAATLYLLSQPGPSAMPQAGEQPADELPQVVATLPAIATVTPSPATPEPTAPPAGAVGQQLRVTGTGAEGLFLRAEPSTNNQPIKTLPESSVVTVVGEPTSAEGRTWLRVRDETGAEGWAASDFLQPAQ